MLAARRHMRAGLRPSFISYASGEVSFSASLVINKPSGANSGDIFIAVMAALGSVTWTGASGWTEQRDQGATPALRVATLTAGGSEPSSYTFTASSSGTYVGHIICIRGGQFDTIGASVTTLTGDGALAIAGITSAGGLIIGAVATDSTSTDIAHTTPSGMTLIGTTIKSGTLQPGLSTFYQEVFSGSTGTRTSTTSNGTNENGGILIGIKP